MGSTNLSLRSSAGWFLLISVSLYESVVWVFLGFLFLIHRGRAQPWRKSPPEDVARRRPPPPRRARAPTPPPTLAPALARARALALAPGPSLPPHPRPRAALAPGAEALLRLEKGLAFSLSLDFFLRLGFWIWRYFSEFDCLYAFVIEFLRL